MKQVSNITLVEAKAELEESLVERFVQENLPPKFVQENKFIGMGDFGVTNKEIECCAAELPISGVVEIFFIPKDVEAVRRFNLPVTARFIAFCTRQAEDDFRVAWSCSLS